MKRMVKSIRHYCNAQVPVQRGTEISQFGTQFPYLLEGINFDIENQFSFMFSQMKGSHKIPDDWILQHLKKIYMGTLYSIAGKDEEFLGEYLERNLIEAFRRSLQMIQEDRLRIEVEEDIKGNKGEPIAEKFEILDAVLIKGLQTD